MGSRLFRDCGAQPLIVARTRWLGSSRLSGRGPGILAQRAIHPAERRLVEPHVTLGGGVPQWYDVGDPQPKAIAIEKPACGIVPEAGGCHAAMGRGAAHAQEMLSHALHGATDLALEPPALHHKELVPV